jgi:hypothetical protein
MRAPWRQIIGTVAEGAVMMLLAFVLFLFLFGSAFALEESYPNWVEQPGRRVLPHTAAYLTYAVLAFIAVSAFVPKLRRAASLLFIVNSLALWLVFYLIVSDTIVSRSSNYG